MEMPAPPGVYSCSAARCLGSRSGDGSAAGFLRRQSCVLTSSAEVWGEEPRGMSAGLPALLGLKSCSAPAPLPPLSLLLLPFLSPSPVCHSTCFLIIVCTVL